MMFGDRSTCGDSGAQATVAIIRIADAKAEWIQKLGRGDIAIICRFYGTGSRRAGQQGRCRVHREQVCESVADQFSENVEELRERNARRLRPMQDRVAVGRKRGHGERHCDAVVSS